MARWLVVTQFLDKDNQPTRIMRNTDLDYAQSRGHMQWQTRMRYGQPAAIVNLDTEGPIGITVRANVPNVGSASASTDTRTWSGPPVVAGALGPHTVQIGWFPRETQPVRIVRIDPDGARRTIAVVPAPSSTYRDRTVAAQKDYRYVVYRRQRQPFVLATVHTPPEAQRTSVLAASGKGMWLFFSPNPFDDNYFGKMNAAAIVDQAVKAGLHYVELRTAYGAFWEVTPEAKPTIDAIIDGLADHGIGVVGWTVPRETTFEDLAASVQTAYYRTARGTTFTALAVDLERGDEFMGADPHGVHALALYMRYLRDALGPNYTLVATIEDPYLEHLDNAKFPYAAIAKYSDVLQPMAYWRMMRREPTTADQVKELLRGSYDTTLREARRTLPVSIGGQTTAEGPTGNPPPDEIIASLAISKQFGAIGECFFDWDGTQPNQWDALARTPW
jgi:hypothetical protein